MLGRKTSGVSCTETCMDFILKLYMHKAGNLMKSDMMRIPRTFFKAFRTLLPT